MRVVKHCKRSPGKGVVSKLNRARLFVRAANSDQTCLEQEVGVGMSGSPFHPPGAQGLASSLSQRRDEVLLCPAASTGEAGSVSREASWRKSHA